MEVRTYEDLGCNIGSGHRLFPARSWEPNHIAATPGTLCGGEQSAKRTWRSLIADASGHHLVEQIGVALAVSGVAAACRRFESRAVEHREITPLVFDQAILLQRTAAAVMPTRRTPSM